MIKSACIVAVSLSLASAALAQSFPSRPVRIVVPFPPGGSVDLIARTIGPHLAERFGQPVVVENKPGAAGQIGVAEVAKGAADGHAVVLSSPGAAAINMHLRKLSYDPAADLAAITPMAIIPTALAVNPALPVNTLAEFISYARERPGQLNFSISGVGSQGHLAGELLKARAGLSIQNIPFSGTAPATTAILSGQVQAGISDLTTLLPLAQDGSVRILAVVDAKRAQSAPQIPTVAESALPGFVASGWVALFAAAATPPAVLDRWNAEVTAILDLAEVRAGFVRAGMEADPRTRQEAREFHLGEIRKWGDAIRSANIKVE